jgi:hypothetical protein
MIHEIKIKRCYFEQVVSGKKSYEIRRDDRPYCVGDYLGLNEFSEDGTYTGRWILVSIDAINEYPEYVSAGYLVLSISPYAPKYIAHFNAVMIMRGAEADDRYREINHEVAPDGYIDPAWGTPGKKPVDE